MTYSAAGEKPEDSRNNDNCQVASEDCNPWNSVEGYYSLATIAMGEC